MKKAVGVSTHLGLVQFAQVEAVLWEEAPPVSSHWNALAPSGEVNAKATDAVSTTVPGDKVIVAEGPAVSIVTCHIMGCLQCMTYAVTALCFPLLAC